MNLDLYAGPGGWDEAARMLGLTGVVGIEWDGAACATRAAAGHRTIRADVSAFPVERLEGRVTGLLGSPPCVTFSGAGSRAGVLVLAILADGIRDAFAGRATRARRRREMAHTLRCSRWLIAGPAPRQDPVRWRRERQQAWKKTLLARKGSPAKLRRAIASAPPGRHLTRAQRSAKIREAVVSASQVIEPARFIHASRPEWVCLEQVPEVLPLWRVYAAELRRLGYSVWCGKVNTADYGVPQTRTRAILIASRVRTVRRPVPTHYDPRKGQQLWGTPWVSMAQALGWGATIRPGPVVTSGGTQTGGAEPFGHRDRDMLAAEREAGNWALRIDAQANATCRPADLPADTIKSGHSSGEMAWVLNPNASGHMRGYERDVGRPSPGLTGQVQFWSLHRSRGASVDRRDHPVDEPAPTITGAGGKPGANLSWFLRNNNNNASVRSADEPAGTLFFGHRSNWAAWVTERPATSVMGDPRIGRPGHKERESGGESHFAVDSVRITVEEAAILQSFPPGYPWRGSKTKQFEQVGNAWCPRAAAAVVGEAAGVRWQPLVAAYYSDREPAA